MFPTVRMRRCRSTPWIRAMVRETTLTREDLILPLFVKEGKNLTEPVPSMPEVFRHSIDSLIETVEDGLKNELRVFAIFPNVDHHIKSPDGKESYNPYNLVCNAIRNLKKEFGNEIALIADVALDPYTTHGHDGIFEEQSVSNSVSNDLTLEILGRQSLVLAAAGCDIIAPSDMMDGRIRYIRETLDNSNYSHVPILSYAAKYFSSFYEPFREAIGSKLEHDIDKSTYQMDCANRNEAIREVELDLKEGADFVMVKPSMFYMDVIRSIKDKFHCPVLAYQVSGEYSMLAQNIDNLYESMLALKRAGSSAIVSYASLILAKEQLLKRPISPF